MTNPTPDPLALAEEALRNWAQDVPDIRARYPKALVLQVLAALRAAHEESQRLREALGVLIDAVEDNGISCCGCGCCCSGQEHNRMRKARDAAQAALAGGKGEG